MSEDRTEFVRRHLAKGGWWRFRGDEAKAAYRLVLSGEALWRTRKRPVDGFLHHVAVEFAAPDAPTTCPR
jgi:hypothetical protein